MNESKPKVKLLGEDGNAFYVIGASLHEVSKDTPTYLFDNERL